MGSREEGPFRTREAIARTPVSVVSDSRAEGDGDRQHVPVAELLDLIHAKLLVDKQAAARDYEKQGVGGHEMTTS